MKKYIQAALDELRQVKRVARERFAWPGGYELFMVTRDGACLCSECCRKEFRQIAWGSFRDASTGWRYDGIECASNLESAEFVREHEDEYSLDLCDHCGKELNP